MEEETIIGNEPAVLEPTPPDERLLNMIAELTLRVEKLEADMVKAKTGLPQLPW